MSDLYQCWFRVLTDVIKKMMNTRSIMEERRENIREKSTNLGNSSPPFPSSPHDTIQNKNLALYKEYQQNETAQVPCSSSTSKLSPNIQCSNCSSYITSSSYKINVKKGKCVFLQVLLCSSFLNSRNRIKDVKYRRKYRANCFCVIC